MIDRRELFNGIFGISTIPVSERISDQTYYYTYIINDGNRYLNKWVNFCRKRHKIDIKSDIVFCSKNIRLVTEMFFKDESSFREVGIKRFGRITSWENLKKDPDDLLKIIKNQHKLVIETAKIMKSQGIEFPI